VSLTDALLSALAGMPPWLVVFLISTLPFVELRGGIPVAYFVYHMSICEAFAVAAAGNLLPVPLILKFFSGVERWLRRWRTWDRFFEGLFRRTRKRASRRVSVWKEVALILFVAVPLPYTGAWTGSLIAYLFEMDFKKSVGIIAAGVLIAGVIVSAVCVAFGNVF